jgi:hypothetical protein
MVRTGVSLVLFITADLAGRLGGVCLTVTVSLSALSFPVCPYPLIIKTTVNKKQNIDFTQVYYGAKIYGRIY